MQYFFLLLLFITSALQAQQLVETRALVTVTGEATEKVVPDMVIFSYSFTQGFEKSSVTSSSLSEQEWLKQNFRFVGIPENDMVISLETVSSNKSLYSITKVYTLTLKDINKYREVLTQLMRIDKGEIINVEFRTSKLEEYKNRARKKAIVAAREKALLLSGELHQNVGKAFTISEESIPLINHYETPNKDNPQPHETVNDIYLREPGYISIPARVKVSFELN